MFRHFSENPAKHSQQQVCHQEAKTMTDTITSLEDHACGPLVKAIVAQVLELHTTNPSLLVKDHNDGETMALLSGSRIVALDESRGRIILQNDASGEDPIHLRKDAAVRAFTQLHRRHEIHVRQTFFSQGQGQESIDMISKTQPIVKSIDRLKRQKRRHMLSKLESDSRVL